MTWCAPTCLYPLWLALMGVVWPAQASAAADALGEVPTQEPSRPSPKPGMKKASKPAKKGGDVKRKSMTAQMLSADMQAALADDLLSADSIQEEGEGESSAAEVRRTPFFAAVMPVEEEAFFSSVAAFAQGGGVEVETDV